MGQQIVPAKKLGALNSWHHPTWVAALPRPSPTTLAEAAAAVAADALAVKAKDKQSPLNAAAAVLRTQREEHAQALLESLASPNLVQEILSSLYDAQNW